MDPYCLLITHCANWILTDSVTTNLHTQLQHFRPYVDSMYYIHSKRDIISIITNDKRADISNHFQLFKTTLVDSLYSSFIGNLRFHSNIKERFPIFPVRYVNCNESDSERHLSALFCHQLNKNRKTCCALHVSLSICM